MEDLFSTSLAVNNSNVTYHVIFDREEYVFLSDGVQDGLSRFAFRREHDQWEEQEKIPDAIRKQAIDALERYLLKQH
jgi:hypothetical protein